MSDSFELKELQDYSVHKIEIRNVMFVGRSRCGKSTVVQQLVTNDYIAPNRSLFADHRTTESHSICLKAKNTIIAFNILDTPGFCDVGDSEGTVLADELVCDIITESLFKELRKIHHLCFCINAGSGITTQDIKAFEQFKTCFHVQDNCSLVITHAETFGKTAREKFLADLRQKGDLQLMRDMCGDRLFFTGAVTEAQDEEIQKIVRPKVQDDIKLLFYHLSRDNLAIDLNFKGLSQMVPTVRKLVKENSRRNEREIFWVVCCEDY